MTPIPFRLRSPLLLSSLFAAISFLFITSHAAAQPVPLSPGISVSQFKSVATLCTRMALDPVDKDLYYLELFGDVHRINMHSPGLEDTVLFTADDHHIVNLQCIVFLGRKMFLIGDVPIDTSRSVGLIMRGTPKPNGSYKWDTVAYTESYPKSNTTFDHGFSGITINPTGDSLFINSGSRTDHGEEQNNGGLYPGAREVPLTSAIFRIPANAKDLYLANDSAALAPYLYADGTRNSYDLAFGPGGELFATENAGERDDPEELNWIRNGRHYGFPWKAGGNFNPQQYPGYDPYQDPLLVVERNPAKVIFFHDDPDFPPLPPGLMITDGIQNLGPDANYYRDSLTGLVMQADETGKELRSFTPHRSPLGLVFDLGHHLAIPYCGDAFMLSYQSQGDSSGITPNHAPGTPLDPSEDLIHLELSKNSEGTNYTTFATRIVSGFRHPVDAIIDSNIIYVLEISSSSPANIWKVTMPVAGFKTNTTAECQQLFSNPVEGFEDMISLLPYVDPKMTETLAAPITFRAYPSPFQTAFELELNLPGDSYCELWLSDITGKKLMEIIPNQLVEAGQHNISVNAAELPSGLYFIGGMAGGEGIHSKIMKMNQPR